MILTNDDKDRGATVKKYLTPSRLRETISSGWVQNRAGTEVSRNAVLFRHGDRNLRWNKTKIVHRWPGNDVSLFTEEFSFVVYECCSYTCCESFKEGFVRSTIRLKVENISNVRLVFVALRYHVKYKEIRGHSVASESSYELLSFSNVNFSQRCRVNRTPFESFTSTLSVFIQTVQFLSDFDPRNVDINETQVVDKHKLLMDKLWRCLTKCQFNALDVSWLVLRIKEIRTMKRYK